MSRVCLLGTIAVPHAYFHCKACRSGCCPADLNSELMAAERSPAAHEVVVTARAVDAFGQAGRLVGCMAGIRLCESTTRRASEAVRGVVSGSGGTHWAAPGHAPGSRSQNDPTYGNGQAK